MTGFDHEFIDPFELSPTLFYSDMESGNFFFDFPNGHVGSCIYRQIDMSKYRFALGMFLQIVIVSTHMAMFYSEE